MTEKFKPGHSVRFPVRNSASVYGGGRYVDPTAVSIVACNFAGNAALAGADLYNLDSAITILASSIANVTSQGGSVTDPLAALLAQVATLDLNRGVTNSLSSKLKAAEQSLASHHTTAAVHQLDAFNNQIEALVASHRLGQLSADALIAGVDSLPVVLA